MALPIPPDDANQRDRLNCWRIHRSLTFPDRFYFYNYLTGENAWKFNDIAGIQRTRDISPDSGLFPDCSSPILPPPAIQVNSPVPSTSRNAAQHVDLSPPPQQHYNIPHFQVASQSPAVGQLSFAVDRQTYDPPAWQGFQDNTIASPPNTVQSLLSPARQVTSPVPSTSRNAAQHAHFLLPSPQRRNIPHYQVSSRNPAVGGFSFDGDGQLFQMQSFQDVSNASRPVALQSFSLPIAAGPNMSCGPPSVYLTPGIAWNPTVFNMYYPSTQMTSTQIPAPNHRCSGVAEPPPFQDYPLNQYRDVYDDDEEEEDCDVSTAIPYRDLREKLNYSRKPECENQNAENTAENEILDEEETVVDSANRSASLIEPWYHGLDSFVANTKITIPEAILLVENRFCDNYKPEEDNRILYVVLDTNYLMHNLEFISILRTAIHQAKKDSRILVPLKVEQEVRLLKENKVEAKKANRFIRLHQNDTKFSIQSSTSLSDQETREWNNSGGICKGDLQILLCCAELTEQGHSVVLLTNDINFSNMVSKEEVNVLRYCQVVRLLYRLQGKSRGLKTANIDETLDAGDVDGKVVMPDAQTKMAKKQDEETRKNVQQKISRMHITFNDDAKNEEVKRRIVMPKVASVSAQPKTPKKAGAPEEAVTGAKLRQERIIIETDETALKDSQSSLTKRTLIRPTKLQLRPALKETDPPPNTSAQLKTPKKIIICNDAVKHNIVSTVQPKTPRKRITYNDDESDKCEQPPHKIVVLEACPKSPKKVDAVGEDHEDAKRVPKTPRRPISFSNDEPGQSHYVAVPAIKSKTPKKADAVEEDYGDAKRVPKTPRRPITSNNDEPGQPRNVLVPVTQSKTLNRKDERTVQSVQQKTARRYITFNEEPGAVSVNAQRVTIKKVVAPMSKEEEVLKPRRVRVEFESDEIALKMTKVVVPEAQPKTPTNKDEETTKSVQQKTSQSHNTFNENARNAGRNIVVPEAPSTSARPKTPKKPVASEEEVTKGKLGQDRIIIESDETALKASQVVVPEAQPKTPTNKDEETTKSVQQKTSQSHNTFSENAKNAGRNIVPEAASTSAQPKTPKKPVASEEEVTIAKLGHDRIKMESDETALKASQVIEVEKDAPMETVKPDILPTKECENERIESVKMKDDSQRNNDITVECSTASNNNNHYSDEYLNNFFSDNEQPSLPKRRRKSSANGTESLPSTHTSHPQLPLVPSSQSTAKSNCLSNIELHRQTSRMKTIVKTIQLLQAEKATEPIRDLFEDERELQVTIDHINRLSTEEYIIDQLQGWLCTVRQKLEDLLDTVLMSYNDPLEKYVSSWNISKSLAKLAARFHCVAKDKLDRMSLFSDIEQLEKLSEERFDSFTITRMQMKKYNLFKDIKSGKFKLEKSNDIPVMPDLISFYKLLYSMLKQLKVKFEDIYIKSMIEDALNLIKDIGEDQHELHDPVLDRSLSETSTPGVDGGADVRKEIDLELHQYSKLQVKKYINKHFSDSYIEDAMTESATCEDVPVDTPAEETSVPEAVKDSPITPRIRIRGAKRPYMFKKVAKQSAMKLKSKYKNLNIQRTIINDKTKAAIPENPLPEQGEASQNTVNLESMQPKDFLSAVYSHLAQLWLSCLTTLKGKPVTSLAFTQFITREIKDFMTQSVANLKTFTDVIKFATVGHPVSNEDVEKFMSVSEALLKGSKITKINIEFKEVALYLKEDSAGAMNYFTKLLFLRSRFKYYLRHEESLLQQFLQTSHPQPQF